MLAALEQCEFIPDEDVAWIAVSSSDIKLIPGEIFGALFALLTVSSTTASSFAFLSGLVVRIDHIRFGI